MAASWAADRFPQFEQPMRRLVEQHRELEDEPLHLAVSYLPALRDQQDIFLLEVIGGSLSSLNPEGDLFEVTFGPNSAFPLGPNEQLHLILTNPREMNVAVRDGWTLVHEIANAVRAGDYHVLYSDDVGQRVLTDLQTATRPTEAARG